MKFELKRLNTTGSSHIVALMLVLVGVGIIGTYKLVASHADPLATTTDTTASTTTSTAKFVFYNNKDGNIYSGNGAGTITPLTVYGQHPIYTHGGTQIYFAFYNGQQGIFSMSSTGANITKLVSSEAHSPSWSESAQALVYSTYGNPANLNVSNWLYVRNSSGVSTKIYDSGTTQGISGVQVSPNGKKILFSTSTRGTALYVINADGSGLTKTPAQQGADYISGVGNWSPDSSKIVYTNFSKVHVITLATLTDKVIYTPKSNESVHLARWSPDGTKIAVSDSLTGSPTRLGLIPATGGALTVAATFPADPTGMGLSGIDWSPDSTKLVVIDPNNSTIANNTIRIITPSTKANILAFKTSNVLYDPSWSTQ